MVDNSVESPFFFPWLEPEMVAAKVAEAEAEATTEVIAATGAAE
jgi:hypothetical protein